MIQYVRMTSEQVAAVSELEKRCFSVPWSERSIAAELDNNFSLWIVAMDGQRLAGYVGSQISLDEADMMNIAVDPAYRRQGIAQGLVSALIAVLKTRGACSLTLEVRASNDPAKALYSKLGFEQAGRRPNYYSAPKEDALILRKEWDA